VDNEAVPQCNGACTVRMLHLAGRTHRVKPYRQGKLLDEPISKRRGLSLGRICPFGSGLLFILPVARPSPGVSLAGFIHETNKRERTEQHPG